MTTLTAQLIYDLYHATAIGSGEDMQENLNFLCGRYSPPGRTEIDLQKLAELLDNDRELCGAMLAIATMSHHPQATELRTWLEDRENGYRLCLGW